MGLFNPECCPGLFSYSHLNKNFQGKFQWLVSETYEVVSCQRFGSITIRCKEATIVLHNGYSSFSNYYVWLRIFYKRKGNALEFVGR